MNIKVTPKMIKEMCGTVSFKKGDSFHRANKITFQNYYPDKCEATVLGMEEFYVTIEATNGGIHTRCSCPKLASFQKDCQHIAAVLLTIYEHQRHGTSPLGGINNHQIANLQNQELSVGLLNLFNEHSVRSSEEQLHFENRKVLEVEFICKPVLTRNGHYLFGIEVKVDDTPVQNIRDFLKHVKELKPFFLSRSFTYDPRLHCFQKETNALFFQLINMINDENVTIDAKSETSNGVIDNKLLLILPSSWERVLSLLKRVPLLKIINKSKVYDHLSIVNDPLPLQFDLNESSQSAYQLKVVGLKELIIMTSYNVVLSDGNLIQMKNEEFKRLTDLNQMLESSDTSQILIQKEQINFFIEKVVPGLRKLGDVKISTPITNKMVRKPLVAKLYLDRLKNRLLGGLEFHYENTVINPLEKSELRTGSLIIRDVEKEEEILQLMDESAFSKTEGGYSLQNEELEYEFLYHVVPKLQNLVQIYATTAVKIRIFKGNPAPQIRVKLKKERTNWLEFNFEINGIPDTHIQEILEALEEKRKFYRLKNGSFLSLETKEFENMKQFLTTVSNKSLVLENSLNVPIVRGLRILDSVEDSNVYAYEASFRKFIDNLRNPTSMNFPIPKRLEHVLRDYQKQGFQWMKTLASFGFGGILADDMGLGKTLQSITFIVSELTNIRKKKLPVLVVCPSSLTYNWLNELNNFAPDVQAVIVEGKKEDRSRILNDVMGIDVIITSYPLLRRDTKLYENKAFHTAFFDEAQAFKNPSTQTSRAVKKIQADYRFALTGTPVENSLVELWSIFHVVFPELFLGLKEYSNLSNEAIARRTGLFLLRRLKEDVLSELPAKIQAMEKTDLFPDQKKLYAAYLAKLKHETLKHLDKNTLRKNRIKILAGLTRLRQICCHPSLFVDGYKGSSAKYEQLMQLIEEAKLSGRRVLIFSQFTKMLDLIGRDLAKQGKPFFYLDGQTPSKERMEICQRFNKGERNLFLISLKAGGTGLNLTGADTVILYDIWWNPAVEEQAADRAHRIGQTNVVQVIKLIAQGTIEEKINELQQKKRHLIEEIINPREQPSSNLTDEDIREILMI